MHVWEGIRLAFGQIHSQKLKSFFSVLGVVIGVMFLIVVVSVVEGMDRYIREDVSSQVFGINTVTLQRWPEVNINTSSEEWRERMRYPRLTEEDAAYCGKVFQCIADVGPPQVQDHLAAVEQQAMLPRQQSGVLFSHLQCEVFQFRPEGCGALQLCCLQGKSFDRQEVQAGTRVWQLAPGLPGHKEVESGAETGFGDGKLWCGMP